MAQALRRNDGFSLVELLIVVIVLGILAAIIVFAIGTARRDAVANVCRTDFASVEHSAAAVVTRTGAYPPSEAALVDGGIPGNGALLRSYPTSQHYRLVYTVQTAGGGNGGSNGNGGNGNGGGNAGNGNGGGNAGNGNGGGNAGNGNGGGNGHGGSAGAGAAAGYTITVQRPDGTIVGTSQDACDAL